MMERNVRVEMIGDPSYYPPIHKKALYEAMEETKHNTGLILNFALNYGSRSEMVNAMKMMLQKCRTVN